MKGLPNYKPAGSPVTRSSSKASYCEVIPQGANRGKPSRRKTAVRIDYRGFRIPDRFVVGYGLDFNENYRSLPDIRYITAK